MIFNSNCFLFSKQKFNGFDPNCRKIQQEILQLHYNIAYLQTPYALTAPNDAIANVVPTNNGADSSR